MTKRKYDLATAQAIFEMVDWPESWSISENGVFVNEGFRGNSPSEQGFDWKPAYEMDWLDAPNPITAPVLPIPFTAEQLAAAMLDGAGGQIQSALNCRIGYALDDDVLQRFGSYHLWVRNALTEAYNAACQAQAVVGELDHAQQKRSHILVDQYEDELSRALEREGVMEPAITRNEYHKRLGRAKAGIATLEQEKEAAKSLASTAYKAWRTAMVRQLLGPQKAITLPPDNTDAPSVEAPNWDLIKPKRFQGYGKPLYRFLQTAHNEKRGLPTAHDVHEEFKESRPEEIAKMLPDGFDYYTATGDTKGVNFTAIGEAISRMTEKKHQ